MTNTPRQRYGLGSFIKKIGKGAKKVFKSPLGKAALIGGGLWGLGKMGGIGSGGIGKKLVEQRFGYGKKLINGKTYGKRSCSRTKNRGTMELDQS